MSRRKEMDYWYDRGFRTAKQGIPPNCSSSDKYDRMAHTAGWHDGKREVDKCLKLIDERIAAAGDPRARKAV